MPADEKGQQSNGKANGGEGRLADNVVFFARTLRRAGMRVGPAAVTDAIEAVRTVGIGSREEFYWTLHAVFVNRHEDHPVFDEAFRLFWRSHDIVEKMIAMFSPVALDNRHREKPRPGEARVGQAFFEERQKTQRPQEQPEIEIDARLSSSGNEVLRRMDFAQMSVAELGEAKRALARLALPSDTIRTRRFRLSSRPATVDPRATMRSAMRTGGQMILPRYRERREVQPPLVVLADISGSMSQYTRIFLHFLHALTERRGRVHTFLFGTRLTNVTRQMRHRDPDEALDLCSFAVRDWQGGTRIATAIAQFNRLWSRRVLGQGATLLLITDGLERDGNEELAVEMARLHRTCRRLIWLNPLLRFDGFEPRARGVQAMLPHVDELRSVHNLEAMEGLVDALSGGRSRDADPRRFLTASAA